MCSDLMDGLVEERQRGDQTMMPCGVHLYSKVNEAGKLTVDLCVERYLLCLTQHSIIKTYLFIYKEEINKKCDRFDSGR